MRRAREGAGERGGGSGEDEEDAEETGARTGAWRALSTSSSVRRVPTVSQPSEQERREREREAECKNAHEHEKQPQRASQYRVTVACQAAMDCTESCHRYARASSPRAARTACA